MTLWFRAQTTDCGPDCSEYHNPSDSVTLTATADPDSTFLGWEGACEGADLCIVPMESSKNVTAIFDDTTNPDTILTDKPVGPSNSTSASFSFTSTEPLSTFQCQLDSGNYETCLSPVIYPLLAEGSHTFSVRATDLAGNPDPSPATYTWTIDITPPDTDITAKPNDPTNSTTAGFSFTSTELLSTFQCQLDNGSFASCSSPVSYSGLAEGNHTFSVKATDPAGNQDPSPASYTWTIDITAPETTASPPGGTYESAVNVTLTPSEEATVFYTTDGSIPDINSMQYSQPPDFPATTILKFFARDRAGNNEAVKTEVYTVVYSISGAIRFWNGGAEIADVQLHLQGDQSYDATGEANGSYSVRRVLSGSYTLTPSHALDVNGITAYDASLVLQHSSEYINLSGYAATAADVNKSGNISSMDASYILQKAVGLISLPFPEAASVWEFDPPSRFYNPLNADLAGQDFIAILLGDVSGNWAGQGSAQRLLSQTNETVFFGIKQDPPLAGGKIPITIWVRPGIQRVYSFDLTFKYDASGAVPVSIALGEILKDWVMIVNQKDPGQVLIAMAGARPMSGEGAIVTMDFTALNQERVIRLQTDRFEINEFIMGIQENTQGDIDNDGYATLRDAILALRIMAGLNPAGVRSDYAVSNVDVDGDNKIGLTEVMYILQKAGGMR